MSEASGLQTISIPAHGVKKLPFLKSRLSDGQSTSIRASILPDAIPPRRDGVTDATSVVNHIKYDSYGNITAQSGSFYQPFFAYTSRQWDGDAGLQYNRARWYDPGVGKFISEDPAGFGAGDINLSRYVNNSPVNFTDPSGLIKMESPHSGGATYIPPGPVSSTEGPGFWGGIGNWWDNNVGVMINNPGATIGGFFSGLGDSFMSGEAYDSANGAIASIVDGLTFDVFDFTGYDPVFGHRSAYSGGAAVGTAAVVVGSIVSLPFSLQSLVSGGVGLYNSVQVVKLVLTNGQTITVLSANASAAAAAAQGIYGVAAVGSSINLANMPDGVPQGGDAERPDLGKASTRRNRDGSPKDPMDQEYELRTNAARKRKNRRKDGSHDDEASIDSDKKTQQELDIYLEDLKRRHNSGE